MSHPIDDLFKKGLNGLPQEGHEEGWAKARVLLGFEKRRKKRFFLWFFFGSLTLMVAVASIGMNYWNSSDTAITTIIDSQSENDSKSVSQINSNLKDPIEAKQADVQLENNTKNGYELTQLENQKSNKETQKRKKSKKQTVAVLVNNSPSKTSKVERKTLSVVADEPKEKESKSNLAVALPINLEGDSKREIERNTLDYVSSLDYAHDVEGELSVTSTILSSVTRPQGENKEEGTSATQESDAKSYPSNATISKIEKLELRSLHISRQPLVILDGEPMGDVKDNQLGFEKSLYADYHNRFKRIGLGASARLLWDDKWSSELSLGMNRSKNNALDNIETTTVFAPNVRANVASTNEYEYYSINLTLRLARHVGRSRFFGGFELERPIFLNGLQQVDVSPQMSDIDQVDMPMGSPILGATDPPITSVIDYNLNTVPELNRFILYGQVGYGYRISSLMDLSLLSSYQFSKPIEASPLLPQGELETGQKKWNFAVRVDFRF